MTATRTTHTKLTFYQAEGDRGGNTQERGAGDPGKVAEAANRAQKGVCVCVCVLGAEGGRRLETSGSPALPGPRPQRRPTRARTPRARGNGVPEGAALTSAFPDAESLSGRRLGVRASQTSRNCRCPLATLCPPLTPSPPCARVPRPGDSSLGRDCPGGGAARQGLGFRLPLPPPPPRRTRPRPERGRRRAPR